MRPVEHRFNPGKPMLKAKEVRGLSVEEINERKTALHMQTRRS